MHHTIVFESLALMQTVYKEIAETINRSVVDSVDVTDKDAIRQMFGK